MRSLTKFAAFALLTGCAAGSAPRPALDPLLQELVEKHRFMGAVVISVRGAVVHESAHGYADLEAARPFTVNTPSDTGSIAKTFTAAAIQALALEGRVALDSTVQSHLPAFPHRATRVSHLLSHTARLPSYESIEKRAAGRMLDNKALLALLRDHDAPAMAPGIRFEYDNVAYDMAALVIEAASGLRYEQFLVERFLRPLDLRDSFVRPARFADWPGPRTRGAGRWASPRPHPRQLVCRWKGSRLLPGRARRLPCTVLLGPGVPHRDRPCQQQRLAAIGQAGDGASPHRLGGRRARTTDRHGSRCHAAASIARDLEPALPRSNRHRSHRWTNATHAPERRAVSDVPGRSARVVCAGPRWHRAVSRRRASQLEQSPRVRDGTLELNAC